jgi:hypothetical protein
MQYFESYTYDIQLFQWIWNVEYCLYIKSEGVIVQSRDHFFFVLISKYGCGNEWLLRVGRRRGDVVVAPSIVGVGEKEIRGL